MVQAAAAAPGKHDRLPATAPQFGKPKLGIRIVLGHRMPHNFRASGKQARIGQRVKIANGQVSPEAPGSQSVQARVGSAHKAYVRKPLEYRRGGRRVATEPLPAPSSQLRNWKGIDYRLASRLDALFAYLNNEAHAR